MPEINLTKLEWGILSDWIAEGLDYINGNGLSMSDWEVPVILSLSKKLKVLEREGVYEAVKIQHEARKARRE